MKTFDPDAWTMGCLVTVPVSDVNFRSAKERATLPQLEEALRRATATGQGKTKIQALERAIRARTR